MKTRLLNLIPATRTQSVLVRIAVRELESWYLGDLAAVENLAGRSGLAAMQNKAKYRDPDGVASPTAEIKRVLGNYSKIRDARAIAPFLDAQRNRSHSFRVFVEGLRRLLD